MVVIRIAMGMGNQMFQYAAARALSLALNEPLKVDLSYFDGPTVWKYELEDFFSITVDKATTEDRALFNFYHPVRAAWNKIFPKKRIRSLPYEERIFIRFIYNIFYLFSPPHKRNVYEERQFQFDNNFFNTHKTVYLKGYWMSPKYFEDYKDVIKKDFTFREEVISHLKNIAEEINNCNSVAVHIRCADRKNLKNLKLYGEIPASYFEAAINYIISKKGNIHLYIFSDDIETAKKYLPQNIPCTFVSRYITKNPIDDFYLITQCKNVIMPNSTFSWWAAYLNKHEDKIVVTPERWYNEAPFNYKDIYYPGWIKMKN